MKDGREIGKVTSGAFSPILEKNIGLAYIEKTAGKIGDTIEISARGRSMPAEIVKTPFV